MSILEQQLRPDFIFDSHCHIQLEEFDSDRDTVIQSAKKAGIKKLMVPAIDYDSAVKAVEIANKYPDFIEVAVGNHPYEADKTDDDCIAKFCELIENNDCITAIGETGLDTYNCKIPLAIQLKSLTNHIKVCNRYRLPIIIHTRETDELTAPVLELLDQYEVELAVFHCFSGSLATAQEIWNRGYKTSLAGNITYKNATELIKVAQACPPELLLVETDSPYLAPEGKRGKRNEPENVKMIYEFINKQRTT